MESTLVKWNEKWKNHQAALRFVDLSFSARDFFLNSEIISGEKKEVRLDDYADESEVTFSYKGEVIFVRFDVGNEKSHDGIDENFTFNEKPIHEYFSTIISEGFQIEHLLSSFKFTNMIEELEKEASSLT